MRSATMPWQRNASSSPPPSAMPFSAATTGLACDRCAATAASSRGHIALRLRIAEHFRKSPDVGAGRECARAITGDDEAAHRGIVLALPDDAENFIGQRVMQRIERFRPPDGDDFDAAHVIDEHETQKFLVFAPADVAAAAGRAALARGACRCGLISAGPSWPINSNGPGFEADAKRQPSSRSAAPPILRSRISPPAKSRCRAGDHGSPPRIRRDRHSLARRYRVPCPRRCGISRPDDSARLPRRPAAYWSR